MERILFIYNPNSGSGKSAKHLSDIVDIYTKAGYEVTVYPTQSKGDCTRYLKENYSRFDRISVSGGDGMLHEAVNALAFTDGAIPLCYIPSGTVNDFASSNGIPRDLPEAARSTTGGVIHRLDVGCFNGTAFSYVAAFGFGTRVAYQTDQALKQRLGVMAYVLEILKSIDLIHIDRACSHLKVKCGDTEIEDDFIFGAVSNSKSVASLPNLVPKDVVLDDGLLEGIFIRKPQNLIELDRIKNSILNRALDASNIVCLKGREYSITGKTEWTLDGEDGGSPEQVDIKVMENALSIILPEAKTEN